MSLVGQFSPQAYSQKQLQQQLYFFGRERVNQRAPARTLTFYASAAAPPGSARSRCTAARGCCPGACGGLGSPPGPGTPPVAPGGWPGPACCATGCAGCPGDEGSPAYNNLTHNTPRLSRTGSGCVTTHQHQPAGTPRLYQKVVMHSMWGLLSTKVSSLHHGVHPPEILTNPLKTACGCLRGRAIIKTSEMHLLMYNYTHWVTLRVCSCKTHYNNSPLITVMSVVVTCFFHRMYKQSNMPPHTCSMHNTTAV